MNTLVEGKGIPWHLYGTPAWSSYLQQLTRQAQAFSQAVQSTGYAIQDRVIVFSSKVPPGLEAAAAEVETAAAAYYGSVIWGVRAFELWLGGM